MSVVAVVVVMAVEALVVVCDSDGDYDGDKYDRSRAALLANR